MKAFRFPLSRALHIRRVQLEAEQANLQRITRDREQVESQAAGIHRESADVRSQVASQPLLVSGEIATMPDYQRGSKLRLERLAQQKEELAKRAQEQQRRTVEAERKVKLLEKLHSRRHSAWESGMQREQENFAADAYLARWTVSR